jgi:hypothetical protein
MRLFSEKKIIRPKSKAGHPEGSGASAVESIPSVFFAARGPICHESFG